MKTTVLTTCTGKSYDVMGTGNLMKRDDVYVTAYIKEYVTIIDVENWIDESGASARGAKLALRGYTNSEMSEVVYTFLDKEDATAFRLRFG